ncbi:MAG: putative ABC transporter ATP-binding protein YknY [Porticoccaceae bacterium UBA1117]|nr:MAG: putative ABC transporter ATP-binding protein YknY [Porticoccaceae bacterium UBA1117]
MIEVGNISKQVTTAEGTLNILDKINLSLASGESLAIVGPSGSGKSTLLGILAGLDLPSSGLVRLNGQDITAMDEEGRAAVRAKHVGFVFQSFHLLPGLTALENVALPLELQGDREALTTAAYFLQRVGLNHRTTHYPRQLSGGEQQRVAVARALACRPTILFADEPTGNLDTGTGEKINDLLFELNKEEGTTLVLVTHELNLAARCGQRLVLAAGQQVGQAKAQSAVKVKAQPTAKVKAKPAAKVKAESAAQVKAKPAAKAKAKRAAQVKAKPAAKAKAKPAAQVKAKPAAKAKPVVQVKAKPAVQVKAKPAVQRRAESKPTATPKSARTPIARATPTAKAKVKQKVVAKPKAIAKAKSKPQGSEI